MYVFFLKIVQHTYRIIYYSKNKLLIVIYSYTLYINYKIILEIEVDTPSLLRIVCCMQ